MIAHYQRSLIMRELIDHCVELHARLRYAAEAMECEPAMFNIADLDGDARCALLDLGYADFHRFLEQR